MAHRYRYNRSLPQIFHIFLLKPKILALKFEKRFFGQIHSDLRLIHFPTMLVLAFYLFYKE